MRMAVLADIHGNLPALEAVLQALEWVQPDMVLLNGDLINAVPYSAEVIDVVRQAGWVVVRGNHEFYYLDFGTERALPGTEDPQRWGGLHWLVDQISPAQGAFLGTLPDERTLYVPGTQSIRVAHGVPGRNRVGFYVGQDPELIASELMDVSERTVISAHTHVQVDRHICWDAEDAVDLSADPHGDGRYGASPSHFRAARAEQHWHVINPGSVGLPLNGDPMAQFAVLESVPDHDEPGGWQVAHHRIDYDRRPALDAFYTSGLMEAGGVISQLFYWELVTADPEINRFYRWARQREIEPDDDLVGSFARYQADTGRGEYVRERDPLFQRSIP